MKLLIVKTTSFGDIVHTFPALTDAWHSVDGLVCDWLVEAPYTTMPGWHPAVRNVIPVAMRGWRRAPRMQHVPGIRRFIRDLRSERYDIVLDAQGLLKSAVLARLARGRRIGPAGRSAREPLAARLYDDTVDIATGRHAIDRARELFAGALGYTIAEEMDYGLDLPGSRDSGADPYLVFIPGTTWPSKRWPARYWRELAKLAGDAGWRVHVLSGSAEEQDTARKIAAGMGNVDPRPPSSIDALARELRGARAVASVDSGPGHLAAAIGTPGVSIYGATDPDLTGVRGRRHTQLRADFECAPCLQRRCRFADRGQVHPDCYATVPPERVWSTLRGLIQES